MSGETFGYLLGLFQGSTTVGIVWLMWPVIRSVFRRIKPAKPVEPPLDYAGVHRAVTDQASRAASITIQNELQKIIERIKLEHPEL